MPDPRPFNPIHLSLRIFLAFAVIVPGSILYMLLCLILLPSRYVRILAGNVYGKIVGRVVYGLAGARVDIEHIERITDGRPALYVANHTSTIDMWVGMWLCPMRGCGIAKKEVARIPAFGQAYLLSGHLLLDRGNRERAIASMEKVTRIIKKHDLSVWMWPEGTRSSDGRLQPMKKGFVHLALATRLPIVPIVFHGAHRRWAGKTWRVFPGRLRIEVLPPIDTTDWSAEHVDEHAQQLWQVYQDALDPDQRTLLLEDKLS